MASIVESTRSEVQTIASGTLLSIAEQDERQLGGPISVLALQRKDHVRLGDYLQALAERDEVNQGPVLLAIYRLVFPHAFAEEAVLWPVIRRVLPDGHELTLQVEREHQAINQLVTQFEELPRGSLDRPALLARIVSLLGEDVRDEEDVLLPRLQATLSPLQWRLLGVAWETVRRIAPTRAHPVVSRRPPGNVLSALPLSLVDRSRDFVDALRLRQQRPAAVFNRASDVLRRASHALERLPGFTAGEDPETSVAARPRSRAAMLGLAAGVAGAGAYIFMVRRR